MKQILIALMVLLTWCTMAIAQSNPTTTAVTVIGTDTTETDSTDLASDNTQDSSSSSIISIGANKNSNFDPFGTFDKMTGAVLLIPIIAILAPFVFMALALFFIFYFRYKNRKARYQLVEQAIAAGQPLPEGIFKEVKQVDQRSSGIRNTFTGIGIFIFLWAITSSFGIGAIGLLIMFMGLGQWMAAYNREKIEKMKSKATEIRNEENDEESK